MVIHRLVDRGLLSYDEPVARYWPEFGANGKDDITVRDVLRHRSGLAHLKGVTKDELLDHLLMEERLAAAPADRQRGWPAYHALTYGWILSGLARAVTGMGMRELFRVEVARTAEHGWPASRSAAGRLADQGRADSRAAGHTRESGVRLRRAEGGRVAAVGRVRRDVLSWHQILCAGRYPVPRRRGARGQRGGDGTWAGQDVRRDRQWRQHRRRRTPVGGADAGADRKPEAVAGSEHRRADAVSSRLSRIADPRSAQGFRSLRSRRDARLGRSGIR